MAHANEPPLTAASQIRRMHLSRISRHWLFNRASIGGKELRFPQAISNSKATDPLSSTRSWIAVARSVWDGRDLMVWALTTGRWFFGNDVIDKIVTSINYVQANWACWWSIWNRFRLSCHLLSAVGWRTPENWLPGGDNRSNQSARRDISFWR